MIWTPRTWCEWGGVWESMAVSEDEWRGLGKRGRQAIKGLTWDAGDACTPSFKETVAFLKCATRLPPLHPLRLGLEG